MGDGSLAPWDGFRLAGCSSQRCDVHINPGEYPLFEAAFLAANVFLAVNTSRRSNAASDE